jgi:hypothetical protein
MDGVVRLDLSDVEIGLILEDRPGALGFSGDVIVRHDRTIVSDDKAAPSPLALYHLDAVPVRLTVGARTKPRRKIETYELEADIRSLEVFE